MTRAQVEYFVFICLMGGLTVALTAGLDRVLRRRPQGPDVGLAVFVEDPSEPDEAETICRGCGKPAVDHLPGAVDEDIRDPKLERIDDALRRVGPENRDGIDWLLDKRIDAMRRAS